MTAQCQAFAVVVYCYGQVVTIAVEASSVANVVTLIKGHLEQRLPFESPHPLDEEQAIVVMPGPGMMFHVEGTWERHVSNRRALQEQKQQRASALVAVPGAVAAHLRNPGR